MEIQVIDVEGPVLDPPVKLRQIHRYYSTTVAEALQAAGFWRTAMFFCRLPQLRTTDVRQIIRVTEHLLKKVETLKQADDREELLQLRVVLLHGQILAQRYFNQLVRRHLG